jgi:hypothetical protein
VSLAHSVAVFCSQRAEYNAYLLFTLSTMELLDYIVARNEIKKLASSSQHGHCPTPQDHCACSHHYINGHWNGSTERANVALCFLRGTSTVHCMLSVLHIRLQMVGCRDTIVSLLYDEQFEPSLNETLYLPTHLSGI